MTDWLRARFLSTVVTAVVVAGTICGPVALYLVVTADERSSDQIIPDPPDARAGLAGQFASLFVAGWLGGDDLTFFHPEMTADDSGLLVDRVAAVRTTERGQGLFDVVVAADLVEYLEGSEERFRPVGLRFYAVGVAADDTGDLVVMGPPAAIAQPLPATPVIPVVNELSPAATPALAPVSDTLNGFFASYLAGTGDVDLFTSPDSVIVAASPPPFGRVVVQRLGWGPVPGIDDDRLRLAQVEVDAQTATGRQLLHYSLVLAERDGRWEISQVLNAPVVLTRGNAE